MCLCLLSQKSPIIYRSSISSPACSFLKRCKVLTQVIYLNWEGIDSVSLGHVKHPASSRTASRVVGQRRAQVFASRNPPQKNSSLELKQQCTLSFLFHFPFNSLSLFLLNNEMCSWPASFHSNIIFLEKRKKKELLNETVHLAGEAENNVASWSIIWPTGKWIPIILIIKNFQAKMSNIL